ncbi:fimbrial protein, partial [Escherichia coli]|uniref:fimbrial protein n=1 Tax=Escherichia coli TaxID=562 RepID=UPI00201989E4
HRALSEHKTLSVSWSHYRSKGYTNLKEIAAKSKLTDTTVSIPITASYYVYDTNKVKSGALEATALINVKYD